MAAVNSLLVVLSATFSSCSDIFSLGTKKICIARNVNVHPTEKALINPGNLDLAKRLIAGQTSYAGKLVSSASMEEQLWFGRRGLGARVSREIFGLRGRI